MTTNSDLIQVLHVGPEAGGRGGLGTSIWRLLHSPLAECYQMTSLATWRDDAGRLQRILIFLKALPRLIRWCLGRGRRVVHVHAAIGGSWYRKAVCVLLARLLRRPVVLQVRVGPGDIAGFDRRIGGVRRMFVKLGFGAANAVITVSRAGAAELERRFGVSRIEVVPNPPPQMHAPRDLAAAGSGILYVGGFRDRAKGADILLAALPVILTAPHIGRVILAGPGEPPAHALDGFVGGALQWVGWLDEPAKSEIFGASAIFVLPSRSEGMPNALLEAMAHGLGIVATSVGGVPDMLSDEVDALLVPPEDPSALAGAVRRLLDDDALRRRLGQASKDRIASMTSEETWSRLDRLYWDLAEGHRPRRR